MEGLPQQSWTSTARTIVFGTMAAAVLLGMVLGEYLPFTARLEPNKATMFARGGDSMTQLYYLMVARGTPPEEAAQLLGWAADLYVAAYQADPTDFRVALSAAIVLRELGRGDEVQKILPKLRAGQFDQRTRRALGGAYAMLLTSYPSKAAVENSRDYLSGITPGPVLTAWGYRSNDLPDMADRTIEEAARRARPLMVRLVASALVCLGILLSGPAVLVWALVRWLKRRERDEVSGLPMSERWGTREAVEALVLWVFLSVALGNAAVTLAPMDRAPSAYLILAPSLLAAALAIGWVWVVARLRAGIGWTLSSAARSAFVGVGVAGLLVLPVMGLHGLLQQLLRERTADNPILPLLLVPDTALAKAGLVLGVGVVVPALEETLFRGVLFGGLRRRWSFWPAALVSGAIFAVVHMSLAGFAAYLLLGLVFAYLFERSRSLVVSFAAHAAFNIFNLMVVIALFG
ncbi:MAG: lysostaphin resistance A-like protein [Armatimonadota bacterium]